MESNPQLEKAKEFFKYAQALRRDLHRHPELGFREVRTASIVARELNSLGFEVTTGVAETGVVAVLEGSQPGPVILLRFDMDGLPIQEETGAEYASEIPGVMHACGHDAHTATGLAVARILTQCRQEIHGTVKFVFQPAEEALGGAEGMVQAGILEHPRPIKCLALHVWNEKPLGWLGITPGPMMAGADFLTVKIFSNSGLPHNVQILNTLQSAAEFVATVQGVVAKDIGAEQSAVVSITSMQSKKSSGTDLGYAELKGTLRSFRDSVRNVLVERVRTILGTSCEKHSCVAELSIARATQPVTNDPLLVQLIRRTARELFPEITLDSAYQTMVAEDMSVFLNEVPGCLFLVGSANAEQGLNFEHHHPKFDIDENALIYTVGLMSAVALNLGKQP